jgi:hypothetical protein
MTIINGKQFTTFTNVNILDELIVGGNATFNGDVAYAGDVDFTGTAQFAGPVGIGTNDDITDGSILDVRGRIVVPLADPAFPGSFPPQGSAFTIVGDQNALTGPDITLESVSTLAAQSAVLGFNRTVGEGGSLVAEDSIGTVDFRGNQQGISYASGAKIEAIASGAWSGTSFPTDIVLFTVADGESSLTERVRINEVLSIGTGLSSSTAAVVVTRSGGEALPSKAVFYAQGTADNGVALVLDATTNNNGSPGELQLRRRNFGGELVVSNAVLGVLKLFAWDGLSTTNYVITATVNAGGSGYAVDDVLTVDGGVFVANRTAATLVVTSVNVGAITGVELTFAGGYENGQLPPTPNDVTTGGTGVNATIDLTFSFGGGTYKRTGNIQAQMSSTKFISPTSLPTDLLFHTASEGSTAVSLRQIITSEGLVGINTADPEVLFHVVGAGGTAGAGTPVGAMAYFEDGANDVSVAIYAGDDSRANLFIGGSRDTPGKSGIVFNDPAHAISDVLGLQNNGVTVLSIDPTDPFVGINTTEPIAPLHISTGASGVTSVANSRGLVVEGGAGGSGMILLGLTDSGTELSYRFGIGADNEAGWFYSGTTNPIMQLRMSGNSTKMTILNNGNIGIGTTAPGALLDVTGGDVIINQDSAVTKDTSANSALKIVSEENSLIYSETVSASPVAAASLSGLVMRRGQVTSSLGVDLEVGKILWQAYSLVSGSYKSSAEFNCIITKTPDANTAPVRLELKVSSLTGTSELDKTVFTTGNQGELIGGKAGILTGSITWNITATSTADQGKMGAYNYRPANGVNQNTTLTLSASTLAETRDSDGQWSFVVANYVSPTGGSGGTITIRPEVETVNFRQGATLEVVWLGGATHPFSRGSEVHVAGTSNYNGNHTVIAVISDTQVELNTSYNTDEDGGTIQANIISAGGTNNQTETISVRLSVKTMWNDKINWRRKD